MLTATSFADIVLASRIALTSPAGACALSSSPRAREVILPWLVPRPRSVLSKLPIRALAMTKSGFAGLRCPRIACGYGNSAAWTLACCVRVSPVVVSSACLPTASGS
jgi:hypothetical protein